MIVTSVAEDDLGHGVALALQDAVQGGSPDAAARIVISALRNTSYNLSQLLDECASAKDEALRQIGTSDQILGAWRRIDHIVAVALRQRINNTRLS